MKIKILLFTLILSLYSITLFANYIENFNNGTTSFNAGNLREAYTWYVKAYKDKPSKPLYDFLVKLKAKIERQDKELLLKNKKIKPLGKNINTTTKNTKSTQILKSAKKDILINWYVISADLALIGVATYLYSDYNKAANDYDVLYDKINNTTNENLSILKNELDSTNQKGNLFGIACGITGAAIIYTVCDALFLNFAFPMQTAMQYNYKNDEMLVLAQKRF